MKRLVLVLMSLVFVLCACNAASRPSQEAAVSTTAAMTAKTVDYPKKPISLVVGFNAGGGPDKAARAFAAVAPKYLGQQVVIEQKVGSAGSAAHDYVAKGKGDGYTLILTGNTPSVVTSEVNDFGFDPIEDFIFLGRLHVNRGVIAVSADSPYQTFEELTEASKTNPGTITVSTSGVGSSADLAVRNINAQMGTGFVSVPFDSSSDSIVATLGGHVEVYCGSATNALPLVQEGKLKALVSVYAPTADERYPDIKILSDYGITDVGDQYGIGVKAGTPEDIVKLLEETVRQVTEDPDFIGQMTQMGMSVDYLNREEFTSYTKELYELERKVALGE